MDVHRRVGILIVQNCQRSYVYFNSNSQPSLSIGFVSSIKVLFYNFLSAFELKLFDIWKNNRHFMIGWKFRKIQLLLLFYRYLNSKFSENFLRYKNAPPPAGVIRFYHKLITIENYELKNQTRKWWRLQFFRQSLNRKPFVICSINNFYTPLTENIAVRLRLLL